MSDTLDLSGLVAPHIRLIQELATALRTRPASRVHAVVVTDMGHDGMSAAAVLGTAEGLFPLVASAAALLGVADRDFQPSNPEARDKLRGALRLLTNPAPANFHKGGRA